MKKIICAVSLALGLSLVAGPASADTAPLPPEGPAPTCWVNVDWFPNPDNLPPCPEEAQATLYQFARAMLVWRSGWDILGENVRNLQRDNYFRHRKIKRLERRVHHLRAELARQ
jgi:hypothetical protein